MQKEKKYRQNVAAIVLSKAYPYECKFLLARRNDMENVWQFPQGGIDEGEDVRKALFRELKEEIGTDEVEIISEYPKWLQYDFPNKLGQKLYAYDGQTQRYFLVRLKQNARINLATADPEFDAYEFVDIKGLFGRINHFKRPLYVRVIKYFQGQGYI